jgi:hypothetical protein
MKPQVHHCLRPVGTLDRNRPSHDIAALHRPGQLVQPLLAGGTAFDVLLEFVTFGVDETVFQELLEPRSGQVFNGKNLINGHRFLLDEGNYS